MTCLLALPERRRAKAPVVREGWGACALAWVLLLSLLALSGCARFEIADRSVTYNQALGTAVNRLFLLNIVRSSQGRPMYFTQIAKMTTTGMADGSSIRLRLPYPLGAPALGGTRVSPDLQWQSGIQMDTDPLLGQDFYRGFIKPATIAEIQYFLQYGWSRQLVFTMMVEEIDIAPAKLAAIDAAIAHDAAGRCHGDADDRAGCEAVQAGSMLARRCPDRQQAPLVGGLLHFADRLSDACEFLRFQALVAKLRALHFSFVQRPGQHQHLEHMTESGTLDAKGYPTGKVTYSKRLSYSAYLCPSLAGFGESFLGGSACASNRSWTHTAQPSGDFTVVPRSAESMIRFLGDVVQTGLGLREGKPAWTPEIFADGPRRSGLQPLFLVRRQHNGQAVVAVTEDGTRYAIPTEGNGVSMPALALLSEFFGLHQKATGLPTTPSVNLLGR